MTNKNIAILCISTAIASSVVTRYYFPKVNTKTVETTKEVIKTDIKTVTRTITAPDGTTDTTTVTEDHSIKRDSSNKTALTNKQPNWMVSGAVLTDFTRQPPYYGIQVQRRILGPFYIGALLTTKQDVGLSLGFEF